MLTTFLIHYRTKPGTRLLLDLDGAPMSMVGSEDGWWTTTVPTRRGAPYRYLVASATDHGVEQGPWRTTPSAPANEVAVVDRWRAPSPERLARHSSLFRNVVAHRHPDPVAAVPVETTFRLLEPGIPPGMTPAVLGSDPELGGWDPAAAIAMQPGPFPWWTAQVHLDAGTAVSYKYILRDEPGAVAAWEELDDRNLPRRPEGPAVVTDDEFRGLPGWRGAGVAIPVFSLRTAASVGVGQFTDLIPFVDWAATVGMSVVQILPVNDTIATHDWTDSYPYDVVSVRALHPLYADLDALGVDAVAATVAAARESCAGQPEIDYETVMRFKEGILRDAYADVVLDLDDDTAFTDFVEAEWHWLGPYSMWCHLRDLHGTADHRRWGPDAGFDAGRLEMFAEPGSEHHPELRYHWFVQYHLHRQFAAAAQHARRTGVALKGDLPIGVSPTSVEVWVSPELFHLGSQAGAPPDDFAVRGQNWGFPTYDWGEMAKDGYAWWRRRFESMASRVDVYRIDHILGFFRIWEVPVHAVDGLLGTFRPCLPLSPEEVVRALGPIDVGRLTRPVIDGSVVASRFGEHAAAVTEVFLTGDPSDLAFTPEAATQRAIAELVAGGALDTVPGDEVDAVARAVLDLAAEVLLIEVGGGYHPRISWRDTGLYHHLDQRQQRGFDALAEDFFHHRHEELWRRQGRITVPAVVEATDMLACGEDLGMVPAHVPVVMNELGLLALEVERMPKRLGAWISDPADAPYLSVVSPGTHDMSPLREWWLEDPETTNRYWLEALGRDGPPPPVATPEVMGAILLRHLRSPAMLAIAPLADWLAIDDELARADGLSERINDPSDPDQRWRYRMHLDVADLLDAETFNDELRTMIRASGR